MEVIKKYSIALVYGGKRLWSCKKLSFGWPNSDQFRRNQSF